MSGAEATWDGYLRLIAAAPETAKQRDELLAALKKLRDFEKEYQITVVKNTGWDRAMRSADAAIAAAEAAQ